jgi:FlgD Ig-like domain
VDQSLTALGLRFDRYDVNSPASALGNSPGGGTPGPTRYWPATSAATLGMYSAIIWDVGDRSSSALTAEEQQLLQAWIKRPGANRGLLAAGDNLAYDLVFNGQEVNSFFTCTLGGVFLRDIWENTPQDSLTPTVTGAAGTRIALEPFPLSGTCPSLNRFDALATSSCAGSKARGWILYPNTMLASVEKRDSVGVIADSSRSVLLGFSLGAISSTTRRNLLLYRTIVGEFEVPGCYVATGVEETPEPAGSPAARLFGAAPNPFNPWTTIRFTLSRPARVRLLIFDVSGARVRSLTDRTLPAGEYRITWDGKNDRGRELASGAYFYRLEADRDVQAKKLILLR